MRRAIADHSQNLIVAMLTPLKQRRRRLRTNSLLDFQEAQHLHSLRHRLFFVTSPSLETEWVAVRVRDERHVVAAHNSILPPRSYCLTDRLGMIKLRIGR